MLVAPPTGQDAATRIAVITAVDAATYRPHALHCQTTDWPEKNCYIDLWIEALATLGMDPLAILGHTVAADFVGDQWTFFKPPHAELRELYGVDVQELTVWRPMEDHAVEHLSAGRWVCTEADAFWLPDTCGTDYRRKHTKTTITINAIDPAAQRLGYFHNAGYFELAGEDYVQLLRVGAAPDVEFMPFFAELVCIDRRVQRSREQLAARALALLRGHYDWRPATNPFTRFGDRLAQDLPAMQCAGLDHYHAWAFASVRQAGGAFELAGLHLRWLAAGGYPAMDEAVQHFAAISAGCKSLILKAARAATGKPFDPLEATGAMARSWDMGMHALGHALG
jgi:hypothetical protein